MTSWFWYSLNQFSVDYLQVAEVHFIKKMSNKYKTVSYLPIGCSISSTTESVALLCGQVSPLEVFCLSWHDKLPNSDYMDINFCIYLYHLHLTIYTDKFSTDPCICLPYLLAGAACTEHLLEQMIRWLSEQFTSITMTTFAFWISITKHISLQLSISLNTPEKIVEETFLSPVIHSIKSTIRWRRGLTVSHSASLELKGMRLRRPRKAGESSSWRRRLKAWSSAFEEKRARFWELVPQNCSLGLETEEFEAFAKGCGKSATGGSKGAWNEILLNGKFSQGFCFREFCEFHSIRENIKSRKFSIFNLIILHMIILLKHIPHSRLLYI